MRPIHHRVIWWIVDAGAVGKVMERGWRNQCADDLGVHRRTVYAAIRKLNGWGIMKNGSKTGESILNPVIFQNGVNRDKLKTRSDNEKS